MTKRLWTREELIMAFNIYCKITFGQQHKTNPDVIRLAKLIKRTPDSISMKLGNFGSLDPELKARGIKGLDGASNLDKVLFPRFIANAESYALEGETLIASLSKQPIEKQLLTTAEQKWIPGKEKERLVKVRLNQSLFRSQIMSAYNHTCCVSGINEPRLLIAAHIKPWSKNEELRLNFRNGLCLNALLDKAYEHGLMAIDRNLTVHISKKLGKSPNSAYFKIFDKKRIELPQRNFPDPKLLEEHFETRFCA